MAGISITPVGEHRINVSVYPSIPFTPSGSSGGVGGVFYTQSTPSDQWIINHNLGYKPSVQVFDGSGYSLICDIFHYSVNQVRVMSNVQLSGYARLI